MNKDKLKKIFEDAKEKGLDVILELTVPGSSITEIIIIKYGNLERKLKYYIENYDDELKLKRCEKIQILSAKVDVFEY